MKSELRCKRCGYEWLRKGHSMPKTCARCNSPYWQKKLTSYWKEVRRKNANTQK